MASKPAGISKNASRQAGETYVYQPVPAEKAAKALADAAKIPLDSITATSYVRNTVVIRNEYTTIGSTVKRKALNKRMMPGNSIWLSFPGEQDTSALFAKENPVLVDSWFDGYATNLVIGFTKA